MVLQSLFQKPVAHWASQIEDLNLSPWDHASSPSEHQNPSAQALSPAAHVDSCPKVISTPALVPHWRFELLFVFETQDFPPFFPAELYIWRYFLDIF